MKQGTNDTFRVLDEIADAGRFEQLAMAVLRCDEPNYRGLIHTGINKDGKTVKSPVDGVFRVPDSNPPHFVFVHHTTAKRTDLEKKWLFAMFEARPKSCHSKPLCAFDGCVHFVDHTPSF
jgi:hypothetical protein